MALKKTRKTPYGVSADYYRIDVINNLIGAKVLNCVLVGYISEKARRDEKEPAQAIDRVELHLPYDTVGGGSVKEVYDAIKKLDGWKDAQSI